MDRDVSHYRIVNRGDSLPIYTTQRPPPEISQLDLGFASAFCCVATVASSYPERRRASAIGRAGLRNPSSSRSCTGREQIRFLGNVSRDCSRTSPLSFDYVHRCRTSTSFVVVRLHHIIIEVHIQRDNISTSTSKL